MREIIRLVAMATIFAMTTMAWLGFGGLMSARTADQQAGLYGAVADLWGVPLTQQAPVVRMTWTDKVTVEETVYDKKGKPALTKDGEVVIREVTKDVHKERIGALDSTDVAVDLGLDQRRKGLMWFSLYDVAFDGEWTWEHTGSETGWAWVKFKFPVADGVYDDFKFLVNGVEVSDKYPPEHGAISVPVKVVPGDKISFVAGYKSRGQDSFAYRPTDGDVGQLRDFSLRMKTDFSHIDFPSFTLSPSDKSRAGEGWDLDWTFNRLVTGHGMGMTMPTRIQPGPLAAHMSFSAPISLGLFMVWIYVLGLLRKIDVHPVNHLFIAASFFSFHLLFGYSADHLPVEAAFALSAVVSMVLTVSYLRLVVGPRFALFEAGGAQLLYLVGFSLAHFWEGYTGLTVTVLAIVTLFGLMQLTGRVRWDDVFSPTPLDDDDFPLGEPVMAPAK